MNGKTEILEELFQEATGNFPEIRKAEKQDAEQIVHFIDGADRRGDFYFERDRRFFKYNLFDVEHVRSLIESK